jgi:hypothetical protein
MRYNQKNGKMYAFYLKRYMELLDGHHRFYEQDARTIESNRIEYIVSMKQQRVLEVPILIAVTQNLEIKIP